MARRAPEREVEGSRALRALSRVAPPVGDRRAWPRWPRRISGGAPPRSRFPRVKAHFWKVRFQSQKAYFPLLRPGIRFPLWKTYFQKRHVLFKLPGTYL